MKKLLNVVRVELINCISLIMLCIYPGIFVYSQNVHESNFKDVVPITFLFIGIATVIYIISRLIFKSAYKASFVSNVIMLLFLNFELISGLFKKIGHWHIYSTIISLVLIAIAVFLVLKVKRDVMELIPIVFAVLFTFLVLFNVIGAVPKVINKINILNAEYNRGSLEGDSVSGIKVTGTNIYYVIFDEYGGRDNLKYYYGLDNHEFYDMLKAKGFNVSYTSRNEESFSTMDIVPNLMNLEYVTKIGMESSEELQYMINPYLYRLMKRWGYDINTASFPEFLDESMSEKTISTEVSFEDKAGYFVLKNTALNIIYDKYQIWKTQKADNIKGNGIDGDKVDKDYGDKMIDAMNFYSNLSKDKHNRQFNMAYFQTPHSPFFFNSDGTRNNPDNRHIWTNHDYYLGYMQWLNKQIDEMTSTIISNDPDAIIIIQSDHGARLARHEDEELGCGYTEESTYHERNVLNCVYYKGLPLDIEGLSGINTVRKVLNAEMHTEFEMISPSR